MLALLFAFCGFEMRFFSRVLLGLCVVLASCQKGPTGQGGRCVHLNLKNEPMTLDPRKGGDVISSHLQLLLFEGLVRLNEDNTISPAQAKSLSISGDGIIYTFILRDTVWSNGMPVTAYDFEKAWKDILDPAFPSVNAHLLYAIKNAEGAKKGEIGLEKIGIEAKDPKTLVVTLEKPTPYFLNMVSFCVFSPVCTSVDKQWPDWANSHFVCNGPFTLGKWKRNNEIVLEKNRSYWDQGKPLPDEIHFSMVDNELTAFHMFENGKLDLIGGPFSPLPIDALQTLKKRGNLHHCPDKGSVLIAFNVEKAPFNHPKVRKAFAYAIDRAAIVSNITQMGEVPALGAVPPALRKGRDRAFFQDGDVDTARQLLEEGLQELGLTRDVFKDVSYVYSSSGLNRKIAEVLQQQWQSVLGIQVKIENLEHKVLMGKLVKRDFGFAQNLWLAQYDDPMSILERFKVKANVKNYTGWENLEFAQLLDRSFYETGGKRVETLEKAEEIFLEEMPICPIYHMNIAYIAHPDDLRISTLGQLVFEKPAVLAMEVGK